MLSLHQCFFFPTIFYVLRIQCCADYLMPEIVYCTMNKSCWVEWSGVGCYILPRCQNCPHHVMSECWDFAHNCCIYFQTLITDPIKDQRMHGINYYVEQLHTSRVCSLLVFILYVSVLTRHVAELLTVVVASTLCFLLPIMLYRRIFTKLFKYVIIWSSLQRHYFHLYACIYIFVYDVLDCIVCLSICHYLMRLVEAVNRRCWLRRFCQSNSKCLNWISHRVSRACRYDRLSTLVIICLVINGLQNIALLPISVRH